MNEQSRSPKKRKERAQARRLQQRAGRAGEPLEIQANTLRELLGGPLYPVKFSAAIRTILELGVMSDGWRAAFEHAYGKIPADKRIFVRDEMVDLYRHFGEYEMAAQFLATDPQTVSELAKALRVSLKLKRFDEAAAVARKCLAMLPAVEGNCQEWTLRMVLEEYYCESGRWEQAVAVWDGASLSHSVNPFLQTAQFHMRRAMDVVDRGLAVIGAFQTQERALHGTKRQDRSFVEEEGALKRCLGKLCQIVPSAMDSEPASRSAEKKLPIFSPPYDARSALDRLIAALDREREQRVSQPGGASSTETTQS